MIQGQVCDKGRKALAEAKPSQETRNGKQRWWAHERKETCSGKAEIRNEGRTSVTPEEQNTGSESD